MLNELLSATLITIIAAALYLVFLTSLSWAVELRSSLLNTSARSHNTTAICRTCGTNFMENGNVEDGKCQICGKILCSRCGLAWICPLCYKKRADKGRKTTADKETQEKLVAAKIISLLKMKGYSTESNTSYNKDFCINQNNINNFLKSSYSSNFGEKNSQFPEYGSDVLNDSSRANQNADQQPKMKNWEENWLFKKKTSSETFKPLAMFLPSPKQSSRAQIGGIDIDDLSDFSEYSDSEIDDILN